jgi:nucleotide-binding universal stress UspA family protein
MTDLVVATDGSDGSAAALTAALELAPRLGAGVIVVAVAEPPPDYLGRPFWQEHVTKELGRARAALDRAREQVEQAGVEAEYEILEGDPAERIARFAELRRADLVVAGTRGRGTLVEVLLGSVVLGLIRRSTRPVVVVRPDAERRADEAAEAGRAATVPEPATG